MNHDGEMVTRTLRYFRAGQITPNSVMFCAEVPGRQPIWSRQLCTALRLSKAEPKGKAKQQQPEGQLSLWS